MENNIYEPVIQAITDALRSIHEIAPEDTTARLESIAFELMAIANIPPEEMPAQSNWVVCVNCHSTLTAALT